MLGKLLKYEIKAGGFIIPAIYVAIGLSFCFGKLADAAGINQLLIGFAIFSAVAGVCALVLALITSILRYHKSMFCEEGYLFQTLPVSKTNLFIAKVLSSYFWILLGAGALIAGVFSCLVLMDVPELSKIIKLVFDSLPDGMVVFFSVSIFVQLFLFIVEVYFSMTLANVGAFAKTNILFSVIFYFACDTVVNLLEVVAALLIPVGIRFSQSGSYFVPEATLSSIISNPNINTAPLSDITIGIASVGLDVVLAVVLILLSIQLLKKKISLK